MAARVSVVVPLYNKIRYIGRCLDSILQQTYWDLEVIVVDDGSTDGGEEYVRNCPDLRVRLIRQANAGPGAARNRGVRESRGEFLAMLDADDAWEPNYVAESVGQLDRFGPDVACITWAMMEFPEERSTAWRWDKLGIPDGRFRLTPDTPERLLVGIVSNMLPSSVVIRRHVFEEMGGFYDRTRCLFAEDAYLWLKVLMKYGVAFDRAPLTRHYLDASELSMNVQGARPVEPFLFDPEELRAFCPEPLRPLFRRFLAIRALKTASVYGYFGQHGKARELVREFVGAGDWNAPFFALGMLGCTPFAPFMAKVARMLKLNLRA